MNYTGLSCEDIYNNNPETGNKNGYYLINNTQWTFCNMIDIAGYFTFSCAGVGGEWRRIANIEINAVPLDGVRVLTVALASVDHPVTMLVVTQPPSLLMG